MGAPYVDPAIKGSLLELAVRMARGGMLRGIRRAEADCGLFTVVKKVEETSAGPRVHLRLVFDQRLPNELWRDPPWVPLAGPGALAAID
eukprot:7488835-Lingulodinium_polyedra.AAC.1